MSNYGSDISRTLDAVNRQFSNVLFRRGKPPLDAEYNLQDDICSEELRDVVRAMMPSGFVMDPTRPLEDFQFNPSWANMFILGNPTIQTLGSTTTIESNPVIWANVNGWMIPVAGTNINSTWLAAQGEPTNIVRLNPPPESDARIDFVFLEAWQTRLDANPATAHKPAADKIWKYGNVEFGGTNLTDDLEDPAIGHQTSARVQIQYRIRVFGSGAGQGMSADLVNYPDGLGYPNILGQGAASDVVAGYPFQNMREELGDPSLWRSGDGNPTNGMETVDGFSYAIPICAVFRRNSRVYVAMTASGNPNHNGGFNRTPGTGLLPNPLTGAKALTMATIVGVGAHTGIAASDGFSTAGFAVPASPAEIQMPYGNSVEFSITVAGLAGSGLDDAAQNWPYTYIKIGDEILSVASVDTTAQTIRIPENGRSRFGTALTGHLTGTVIEFYNTRPDDLYSDQVDSCDILDLRRGVNANDWDFGRLLERGVTDLLTGKMRTAWKREGASYGGTQGPVIHEVDHLYAYDSTHPNGTDPIDGPDGVRTVWSDAAAIQPNVTTLLDNAAVTSGSTPQTVESFNATVEWDVAPGFRPSGFLNTGGGLTDEESFSNGSVLLFHIGGDDGTEGARGTFRDGSTRAVRFLMPKEMWRSGYPVVDPENGQQHPIQLRFLGERAFEPAPENLDAVKAARHVGPMYPWKDLSFEYPFIALGGILNDGGLMQIDVPNTSFRAATQYDEAVFVNYDIIEIDLNSYDFDINGEYGFWIDTEPTGTKRFTNNPARVSKPLLRGEQTLYGLLTDYGRDLTGLSSEVYLVIYGDDEWRDNNGAFQVIGVGTEGYTTNNALNGTSLVLRPLSADFSGTNSSVAKTLRVEFRTPYHNADDTSDAESRVADLAIVLTDLGGILDKEIQVSNMTISTGDHPWKRIYLGDVAGTTYDLALPYDIGAETVNIAASKALVDLTLIYHPGRGSMNRVPDELNRFALKGNNTQPATGGYLRGNPANIDTTFSATSGVPSNEIWWDPAHVQLWNRLPSLGWSAPSAEDYGGDVVGYTEQDRENELFYDRGSKTAIFRPFRDRQMTLQAVSIRNDGGTTAFPDATTGLEGAFDYLTKVIDKDAGQLFTPNKFAAFPVPFEFMPRFGRQDIPYYVDINSGNGPFLSGVNHLFVDTVSVTNNIFNIIGGEPKTSEVATLIFRTDTPNRYAEYDTYTGIENERPVMFARKTTDINVPVTQYGLEILAQLAAVNSSDFGKGLKGIQLPPYIGPARVLGVYEKTDFEAKGGHTFKSNRWQMEEAAPPNLLKTDADRQTLFILQDGAKDLTTENGDHTYIIPSNAIDFTRSLTYITAGDASKTFDDYEYVVECTVFGFAQGFINENNYVLTRRLNGHGGTNVDNFLDPIEFDDIHMVIPCPAGDSDQLYSAYNRTVYQGDPYFSVNGSAADYTNRYGQISIGHQYDMRIPIQQYDSAGNFVPQITNPKSFEVLASMDFYTTMGTGKMGGDFYSGTPLDIGHTELNLNASKRSPETNTSPAWRIQPRTYSEGQKSNPNRAGLNIICQENASWCVEDDPYNMYIRFRFVLLDGTLVDLYGSTSDAESILTAVTPTGLDIDSEDVFEVDTSSKQIVMEGSKLQNIIVPAGGYIEYTMAVTGGTPVDGDHVVFTSSNLYTVGDGRLIAMCRVAAEVVVTIIDPGEEIETYLTGDETVTLPNPVPADSTYLVLPELLIPLVDLPDDGYTVVIEDMEQVDSAPIGLIFTCQSVVVGLNLNIQMFVHNVSGSPINAGTTRVVRIGVAGTRDDITASDIDLSVKVFQTTGSMSQTLANLMETINTHLRLYQNVKALGEGDDALKLISVPTGTEGNDITVTAQRVGVDTSTSPVSVFGEFTAQNLVYPLEAIPSNMNPQSFVASSSTPLIGGVNFPLNAGDGASQIGLTGMTERLPLGALLQDSDFLCENPLNDHASAVKTSPVGPHPLQTLMPMTQQGEEFERFNGAPGQLLALSDGYECIISFSSWTSTDTGGTKKYRIYRGAGAPYVLSGNNPGGPIDWVSDTFPASSQPVLKGGMLACRAMLVRNFPEYLVTSNTHPSEGDEIQMVVLTYGHLGDGSSQLTGLTLDGIISPSGYGEGYAAADRFRIGGHPMFRGFTRQVPDPAAVQLAVYPDGIREP